MAHGLLFKNCTYQYLPMLIKLPIIHAFARQKEEVQPRTLSKHERIICDRIVIITLFITAFAIAIIFS